ncbi:hypothetical protein C2G38_2029935 [Gigaspora rosea]|uniref:ZSWIM1/3 RNaseH-like domain-containing protein n=1 Tax=Gigaspora rosea TaxID=44941 RepID=A0A397VXT4_9GLOM|nr:hypothetical protein C2G38_2029935 [Gigaspora rosea]
MPLLLDINAIFDIEEEDMVISDGSDHELDNMLDSILDATDCAGQTWETQDDDNTTNNESETEKSKMYHLLLSDLCTLSLSENIRQFIRQRAFEGLDAFSIQQLLRFRAVELQDQVKSLEKVQPNEPLQNIQKLHDRLVTKDDIYTIVHDAMKTCTYLDEDEIKSLDKWIAKIISMGGCCLFEYSNQEQASDIADTGFIFAFQTTKQKEFMQYTRVICLDGTHGMNKYGYHLFSLVIKHPMTGSGYPIAFLISKYKKTITLKRWFEFLKSNYENWNSDLFMVDDAGEDIKAVEEKGWDNTEAKKQVTEAIEKWRNFNVDTANTFASYFEHWWKPKYDKLMTCLREISRDIIDTNNLIEAFHRKLKYTYMRGRPGR